LGFLKDRRGKAFSGGPKRGGADIGGGGDKRERKRSQVRAKVREKKETRIDQALTGMDELKKMMRTLMMK